MLKLMILYASSSVNCLTPSIIINNFNNIVEYNNIIFAWTINDNIISFGSQLDLNNCQENFLIGFNGEPNTFINSDIISFSNDKMCNFNIESYKLSKNLKTDTKINYLIDKNFYIENTTKLIITFSRFLDTGNPNDVQIVLNNNTNMLYSINYNIDFYNYYFFDINFKNIPKKSFTETSYFETLILSLSFFTIFIISLSIATTKSEHFKFLYKEIKLPFFDFMAIGNILFISLYIIWWVSMFIYCFLNKNEIIKRLGIWLSLNLSFILLPITRNSLWIIFFKVSRYKLLYLHRLISTLCIISTIIKFIVCLIFYQPIFFIKLINPDTGGSPIAGTLSTLTILLCGVFSLKIIREKFFEIFYYSHRTLVLLSVAFGSWHYIKTFYYILPSITIYIIDLIIRFVKTKKSVRTKIKHIGNKKFNTSCNVINITLKNSIETKPGCYFFLCFYKDISRFQWHPLTLISNTNNTLTFCAKNMGDNSWTDRLEKFSEKTKNVSDMLLNREVLIQGPYNGNINCKYKENIYKNIIIISGGIGITPMISIIKEIDELYLCNKLSNLEKVTIVWIIQHESLIEYFKNIFSSVDNILFNFKIYITKQDNLNCIKNDNLEIISGRPKIKELLNNFSRNNAVLTCGPTSLTDDVRYNCSKFKNIDVFCENF